MGVFVNGTQLDESVLGPGDRVHFGSVEFVVSSGDAPADATIERGRQFDPMAVDAFLAIEGEFPARREAALRGAAG